MTDGQDERGCDCPACQQLRIMDAVILKQFAGWEARGIQACPQAHPWPPQRRGSCQSQARIDALRYYTAPIRGRTPEENDHGQAQVAAAQAVEWYPNDHDDDDDV